MEADTKYFLLHGKIEPLEMSAFHHLFRGFLIYGNMLHELLKMGAFRQYNVALAKETSVNASILLSYLLYQQDQFGGREFYNTMEKISEYTGLKRGEIETATKILVKAGLIKKKLKGLPAISHYHFDEECHHVCNDLLFRHFHPTDESENIQANKFRDFSELDSSNQQTGFEISANILYKNIDNKSIEEKDNIKLHSPKFSEENIPGESDNLFSSIEATQEEPVIEPKKKANPFKLSDDEMKLVKSYHKGFIEEIDKVAQVEYSKDIRHLCRTFKLLKRNRELFCDIYIYFRTYRDPFETYTTEIRSLSSLAEKIDKLQAEMFRETKKVIKQNGSVVLFMDSVKKIAVVYGAGVLKKHDKTRIELMPKTGYTVYDISRSIGKLDFPELGYVERNTFA